MRGELKEEVPHKRRGKMNNFNQNGMMPQQRLNQFSPYFNSNTFNSAPVSNTTLTNNLIWVQGIEGAKAWQLNPNSMVILLDSEAEGKMYIKVSDNIGMSSLRIFNYVEETPQTTGEDNATNNVDLSQFVTKDELTDLVKELMKNEQPFSTTTTASTAGKSNVVSTVVKK